MIGQLRQYFIGRVKEVDSSYQIIDDPIGDDDLARVNLDCKFKVIFGQNSPEYTGNSYTEQIPVTIELYSKANPSQNAAFDALYTMGIKVKNEIIGPNQVKNQLPFNDALVQSLNVLSLNTNDKTFRCTIDLTIRVDFTFN